MNPRMRAFSGRVTLFAVRNISWASSICSLCSKNKYTEECKQHTVIKKDNFHWYQQAHATTCYFIPKNKTVRSSYLTYYTVGCKTCLARPDLYSGVWWLWSLKYIIYECRKQMSMLHLTSGQQYLHRTLRNKFHSPWERDPCAEVCCCFLGQYSLPVSSSGPPVEPVESVSPVCLVWWLQLEPAQPWQRAWQQRQLLSGVTETAVMLPHSVTYSENHKAEAAC
jgi:hypothetical protein